MGCLRSELSLCPGVCPCAVTSSKLVGNVLYNGKCYLWYSNTTNTYNFNQIQTLCSNPTATTCADGSSQCISSGVGRAATFDTWTDFNAVTSAFTAPVTTKIQIGMGCEASGPNTGFTCDPFSVCAPSPILYGSANWPTSALLNGATSYMLNYCNQNNPYVTIYSQWNDWIPNVGITVSSYMCEASKKQRILTFIFIKSCP